MTYDECMAIVDAYKTAILLADDTVGLDCDHATEIRDCLHDFISSLIYESQIGDRGRRTEYE